MKRRSFIVETVLAVVAAPAMPQLLGMMLAGFRPKAKDEWVRVGFRWYHPDPSRITLVWASKEYAKDVEPSVRPAIFPTGKVIEWTSGP